MGLSPPVWAAIGLFFVISAWNLLFLLPIHLNPDNLIAQIFVTIAISVSLAYMLYRNIKLYIWRVFHRTKSNDDGDFNVFAFLWSHVALGLCWGTLNLVLWTWNHEWFANVATVPFENIYSLWVGFFFGSVAMLPGSVPVYIVTPTAPLTWALACIQLLINWTFYLCGFSMFIAIFRKWLLTQTPVTSSSKKSRRKKRSSVISV